MLRYSSVVDGIVSDSSLLHNLRPTGLANPIAAIRIRGATDEEIATGRERVNKNVFPLVRCGLLYAVDAIEEAYRIVHPLPGDTSAYWQGMIHRRLCDFENARHLFRRAGPLPIFAELHHSAARVSPDMAKQSSWDPYLFVGLCEQERFGATQHRNSLVKLQRIEFDALFDYVWRKSMG
jgi:hypothetical protein